MTEEPSTEKEDKNAIPEVLGHKDFFPYHKYRPEQETVIRNIFESTVLGKNVVLIAQNGTGKTIMALSATLPVAKKLLQRKIVFLARTYSQNERVIQEAKEITKHFAANNIDLTIGAISIRGRNQMCPNKTIQRLELPPQESMSVCANLRRNKKCTFFNKLVRKKSKDSLEKELKLLALSPLSSQDLLSYAEQKGYCPYFLSKLLIEHVDVVVCNYQWVFNPFIRENFLEFLGCQLSDCIIIMDECHNLPEMANGINSFRLSPYSLRQALKDLEVYRANFPLIKFVKRTKEMLNTVKNRIEGEVQLDPHKFLMQILNANKLGSTSDLKRLLVDLEDYGDAIEQEKLDQGKVGRNFIETISSFFTEFLEHIDDDAYFPCMTSNRRNDGKKSISLELKCADPRLITDPIFKESLSTLSLSGTLHPYTFINLLGLNHTGKLLKILKMKPPFPKENLKVIMIEKLNTKGTNRVKSMYRNYILALKPILKHTPKNVGVFCASYEVLQGLVENGFETLADHCNKKCFREESGLAASDNDVIIEKFKGYSGRAGINGAVLLGVCGGRNSEGEDFPGDYMNAVVIVGIPFQRPVPSIKAKIAYYEELFPEKGRDFGYTVPAFQRANQACGRPIRTMKDKGLVVLMDSRFSYYREFLSEWVQKEIKRVPLNSKTIKREVRSFFKRFESS